MDKQKTLNQCIDEIFKTVKPHPHLQWRIWKIRFKKKKLSLKIKEKMLRKYGYEKIEDAHYGLKPKEYEWVKLESVDVLLDIWMKETEVESTRQYLQAKDHKLITNEMVLAYTASLYGNRMERTISITRDDEVIEVWERKLKQ